MTLREARIKAKLTQQMMATKFEMPKRTIENWEGNVRKCPRYVERLLLEKLEELIVNNGKEILKKAAEIDEWNQNLPQVEIGKEYTLNDVWDGEGEIPETSYSYQLTDNDWINYEFEFIDKKENSLESIIKITGIDLV